MYLAFLSSLISRLSAHLIKLSTCSGMSFNSGLLAFSTCSYFFLADLENKTLAMLSTLDPFSKPKLKLLLNIVALLPAATSCFCSRVKSLSTVLTNSLAIFLSTTLNIPLIIWPSGDLGSICILLSSALLGLPIASNISWFVKPFFKVQGDRPAPFLILGFLS